MENLLPFYQIMIDHVENDQIHILTSLSKVGEITPETFNNYEAHNYIKVQFANAIPDNCYLSKLLFKVFEPFTNASTEIINNIGLETKNFSNQQNNVVVENLNTNNHDIDIVINLSDDNSATWNAGRIGVYAYLVAIPSIIEATRQLSLLLVDNETHPIIGAQLIINNEMVGVTDDSGTLIFNVTTEEINLSIVKENYTSLTQTIEAGTENIELSKTMYVSEQQTRPFTITAWDGNGILLPDAQVLINSVSIGFTNQSGVLIHDGPITEFNLTIQKAGFNSSINTIAAGTESWTNPVYLTSIIPSRLLRFNVADGNQMPIVGASVHIDNVEAGVTDLMGVFQISIDEQAHEVIISKIHYLPDTYQLIEDSLSYTVSLTLGASRHISLTICDLMQMPLPDVSVLFGGVLAGETNLSGIFAKDITVNQILLAITKEGYISESNTIEAGTDDLIFTPALQNAPPSRQLVISVIDNNSSPLLGVDVYTGGLKVGTTNMMGMLTCDIIQTAFTLYLRKSHFVIASEYVPEGTESLTLSRQMLPGRNLALVVTDNNSMPVIYAVVKINNNQIGTTDMMGMFNDSVTTAEFTLGIEKTGFGFIPETILTGIEDLELARQIMPLRTMNLLVTDNSEIPVPLAGASIKIGDYEIGITGPTGYLNTSIPETETNITASLADYITQELIIEAGIIEINETIALVPAGE